jgi:hypothetical protein
MILWWCLFSCLLYIIYDVRSCLHPQVTCTNMYNRESLLLHTQNKDNRHDIKSVFSYLSNLTSSSIQLSHYQFCLCYIVVAGNSVIIKSLCVDCRDCTLLNEMKGWLNPIRASAEMLTGNLKWCKLVFILMCYLQKNKRGNIKCHEKLSAKIQNMLIEFFSDFCFLLTLPSHKQETNDCPKRNKKSQAILMEEALPGD